MSLINPNNILESLISIQTTTKKSNALNSFSQADKSVFQSIIENKNNGSIADDNFASNAEERDSDVTINKRLNLFNQIANLEALVSQNSTQQQFINNILLDNAKVDNELSLESLMLTQSLFSGKADLIINGRFDFTELSHLAKNLQVDGFQTSYPKANNQIKRSQPLNDLLSLVLSAKSFNVNGKVMVQSHQSSEAESSKSILQIWVPLTSIATGKLSQSVSQQLVNQLYNSENKVTHSKVGSLGESIPNTSPVQMTSSSNQLPKGAQDFSILMKIINNSASRFVFREIERTSSAQYSSGLSYSSQEFQAKKYTFFTSEEGLSVWCRDYENSEKSILADLMQLKQLLEKYSPIKQIGFNGKLIYSSNSTAHLINGEEHAS